MYIDRSIERIRRWAREKRWSNRKLALEAGLHASTLQGLDDPDWSPRADTLRAIEAIIPEDFEPCHSKTP